MYVRTYVYFIPAQVYPHTHTLTHFETTGTPIYYYICTSVYICIYINAVMYISKLLER